MRRVPCSHSSTSALLLSPLIYRGSAPGYSARICQSSSVIRCILKVARGLPIPPNMRRPAQVASSNRGSLIQGAHYLLLDLLGVGHDPIAGLLFGGETVDAALVAFVIPDDDVPAGALLVGKGQHHRLFFFGVHHARPNMPASAEAASANPACLVRTDLRPELSEIPSMPRGPPGTKPAFPHCEYVKGHMRGVGNVAWGSGCQLPALRGVLRRDRPNGHGFGPQSRPPRHGA